MSSNKRIENIKLDNKLSSGNLRFLKIITPDGNVYAYDNNAIIPTAIQLKTSVQEFDKPFKIRTENFVLTEDMIDLI